MLLHMCTYLAARRASKAATTGKTTEGIMVDSLVDVSSGCVGASGMTMLGGGVGAGCPRGHSLLRDAQ